MAGIVCLTLNPAVDITYRVDDQVLGETLRVRQVLRRPGGKGVNTARILHQLGYPVRAIQPVGGSTGDWFGTELETMEVPALCIDVAGTTRSTVTVTDPVNHPTVLTEPGEPLQVTDWQAITETLTEQLAPGDALLIAGSAPPETTAAHLTGLIEAAHQAGAWVMVDTSGPMLVAAAQAGADLLTPNDIELSDATGATTIESGAERLLELGAGGAVISRGAEGLWAGLSTHGPGSQPGVEGLQVTTQPAVPQVHGNPTGAGDAAAAGLLASLTSDEPISEALGWASLLGAAAVLAPTAGEIDPAQLGELAARLDPADRPVRFPPPT